VKGVLSAGRACRAVARGPVRSAHAPVRTRRLLVESCAEEVVRSGVPGPLTSPSGPVDPRSSSMCTSRHAAAAPDERRRGPDQSRVRYCEFFSFLTRRGTCGDLFKDIGS
jgi:hypothetical protein